jgi:glutamine amidotransferase
LPLKIAIIDYGMGNLKSIQNILKFLNVESEITYNSSRILNSDGVILPGVGAFGDAMENLKNRKLISTINSLICQKKPLLGICLGLQLLFSESHEYGISRGLDVISGLVIKFDKKKVDKIPQIGWNNVDFQDKEHFLVQGIPNNSFFYFVHSYYGIPKDETSILGKTKYRKVEFASMIQKGSVIATQFHPEKSGKKGIMLYRNFINYCKR